MAKKCLKKRRKRIPYEELIRSEEELTKQKNELMQQILELRSEKNKITAKLGANFKAKWKYFTEKMNKCLSDKSFTIARIDHLYAGSDCGFVSVRSSDGTVFPNAWFFFRKGCTIDDLMNEEVKVVITKDEVVRLNIDIYPIGIGCKCLEAL